MRNISVDTGDGCFRILFLFPEQLRCIHIRENFYNRIQQFFFSMFKRSLGINHTYYNLNVAKGYSNIKEITD